MLNQFEEIRDTLFRVIETRIDLLEVETRGYIERIILNLIYASLVMMAIVVVVVFLLLLLAIYLNSLLMSVYAGYLIVAVFFAIVLTILLTKRKSCMKVLRWGLEKILRQQDFEPIK